MSGHTKGPWFVEIEADPDGDVPRVFVCHSGTECDVTTVCNLEPSRFASLELREANARLISAAPDLLDALKEAADMLARIATGQDWGAIEQMEQDARAAIAKAEGRS